MEKMREKKHQKWWKISFVTMKIAQTQTAKILRQLKSYPCQWSMPSDSRNPASFMSSQDPHISTICLNTPNQDVFHQIAIKWDLFMDILLLPINTPMGMKPSKHHKQCTISNKCQRCIHLEPQVRCKHINQVVTSTSPRLHMLVILMLQLLHSMLKIHQIVNLTITCHHSIINRVLILLKIHSITLINTTKAQLLLANSNNTQSQESAISSKKMTEEETLVVQPEGVLHHPRIRVVREWFKKDKWDKLSTVTISSCVLIGTT